MAYQTSERSPGFKLLLTILIGLALAIPIFVTWLMTEDRRSQSETARASIAEGWGGPQGFAGPMLVIPYPEQATETVAEGGKQVTKTQTVWRELYVAPKTITLDTDVKPERRKRSIYEAVVYESATRGRAVYELPADLSRYGVTREALAFDRAEIRFGLSDPRGVAANNKVTVDGRPVELQPGKGLAATGNSGFFAWIDASALGAAPMTADFTFAFRGNADITYFPRAGQTVWTAKSAWPHPSFQGGFLPTSRSVDAKGFTAKWEVSNLALGTALVSTEDRPAADGAAVMAEPYASRTGAVASGGAAARIGLIQPVDLYDQVSRAAKYGFLFIGFTFLALLMFDVIGGVAVSVVEYLLVGSGLILFFVLLLAFAEVIGFTPAYLIASAGIVGLLTAYSAAVLKSWRRASFIGGLLVGLYAVLYVLLSLEAYSLLIGSLMLFAALAAVMYVTRNIDWGGRRGEEAAAA